MREALKELISAFLDGWESTDWEIFNQRADRDTVMVERMDRTVVNGKHVDLPCFGLFQMSNGKIALWKDYFDMTTYINALS